MMYSTKDFAKQCVKQGFYLSSKNTYSRCVGDGVLQQIFCGDRRHIWIGITSMYADLPDIFWDSKIPFTTYLPQDLQGITAPPFEVELLQNDISILMDGGLAVLDDISTQEKLIQFAVKTNAIHGKSSHLHNNRFWGAYIVCGLTEELMYEVCHEYVDVSEAFRRKKENILLLENHQQAKFVENYFLLDKKLTKLSALWCSLLTNDHKFLEEYASDNFRRNLEKLKERNIPITK